MAKFIELTQWKVAIVDDADYKWLNTMKWYAARTKTGEFTANRWEKRVTLRMHRLIMGNPKCQVDHIDGNQLNNQRSNLRFCNNTQNQQNKFTIKGNTPYKGVYWDKYLQKYRPRIRVNTKLISLGLYDKAEAAAKEYDIAAIKYFGEFARTNKELGTYG